MALLEEELFQLLHQILLKMFYSHENSADDKITYGVVEQSSCKSVFSSVDAIVFVVSESFDQALSSIDSQV